MAQQLIYPAQVDQHTAQSDADRLVLRMASIYGGQWRVVAPATHSEMLDARRALQAHTAARPAAADFYEIEQ
jgi:hypothetical protein